MTLNWSYFLFGLSVMFAVNSIPVKNFKTEQERERERESDVYVYASWNMRCHATQVTQHHVAWQIWTVQSFLYLFFEQTWNIMKDHWLFSSAWSLVALCEHNMAQWTWAFFFCMCLDLTRRHGDSRCSRTDATLGETNAGRRRTGETSPRHVDGHIRKSPQTKFQPTDDYLIDEASLCRVSHSYFIRHAGRFHGVGRAVAWLRTVPAPLPSRPGDPCRCYPSMPGRGSQTIHTPRHDPPARQPRRSGRHWRCEGICSPAA